MKVFAVIFAVFVGGALGVDSIERRGTNDYSATTTKPAAASDTSGPGSVYNAVKYQSSAYSTPQKLQYAQPQHLNYVVQPSYKFVSQQLAPTSPVQYVPQQIQQHQQPQQQYTTQQQYTSQNVVYNTQPLAKIVPVPQKIAYTPAQVQAPSPTSVPYSLAGDVSSFKYSSPLVTYSNLGVIQQALGRAPPSAPSAPAQQEVSHRPQYSQQQIQQSVTASSAPQQYSQPQQQLTYRPKLQLSLAYNPASQPAAPPTVPKFIYTPVPQSSSIPRPQSAYPSATQKLVASAPQHNVYYIPQQQHQQQSQQQQYTPAQQTYSAQQSYSAQPVQPSHSLIQPVYVLAPQVTSQYASQLSSGYSQQQN